MDNIKKISTSRPLKITTFWSRRGNSKRGTPFPQGRAIVVCSHPIHPHPILYSQEKSVNGWSSSSVPMAWYNSLHNNIYIIGLVFTGHALMDLHFPSQTELPSRTVEAWSLLFCVTHSSLLKHPSPRPAIQSPHSRNSHINTAICLLSWERFHCHSASPFYLSVYSCVSLDCSALPWIQV